VPELVATINRTLNGWANYFCLDQVKKAYGAVDYHVVRRLCTNFSTVLQF
jgi:hypothetical protein